MDALVSLGVISTNIVVSVVQEVRAKRTLDRIALLTAPTATVVRDGVERAVPPSDLVVGDLVAVGPGDQVVVDGVTAAGRFRADESQLTGESDHIEKSPGVPVYSGSFCVTGSGRYVVETVGAESVAGRITAGARSFRRVLTPLQRQINLVIRLVLLIVVYLELVLLVNAVVSLTDPGEAVGQATILAGLIPNGLFVSIAIAYALGAVRIEPLRGARAAGERDRVAQQRGRPLPRQDGHAHDERADARRDRAGGRDVRRDGDPRDGRGEPGGPEQDVGRDRGGVSGGRGAGLVGRRVLVGAEMERGRVVDGAAVVTEAAGTPASTPVLSGTYALGAPQMLRPYLPDDAWEAIAGTYRRSVPTRACASSCSYTGRRSRRSPTRTTPSSPPACACWGSSSSETSSGRTRPRRSRGSARPASRPR